VLQKRAPPPGGVIGGTAGGLGKKGGGGVKTKKGEGGMAWTKVGWNDGKTTRGGVVPGEGKGEK